MSDWLFHNFGKCLAVVCAFMVALIIFAQLETRKQKIAFMSACMADHKDYECLVLWGQANPRGNDIATGVAVGTAIGLSAGRR